VVTEQSQKPSPQLLKLGKPFAVLPLGTANDFARTIELPMDPMQAAEVALTGRKHRIDVGLANGILISMLQAWELRPGSLRANQKT
jgi:diacylglycerol kinase family enzyme